MVDQETIDVWKDHVRAQLSTDRHASMITTFVLKCGSERIILSKKIVNNKIQMIIEMYETIEVGQIENDDVEGIVKFLVDVYDETGETVALATILTLVKKLNQA